MEKTLPTSGPTGQPEVKLGINKSKKPEVFSADTTLKLPSYDDAEEFKRRMTSRKVIEYESGLESQIKTAKYQVPLLILTIALFVIIVTLVRRGG